MKKKKFTIDNIEEFLEEIGFKWIEKYVYLTKEKTYECATMNMFKMKPVYLYLMNKESNKKALPLVQITNDEFLIIQGESHLNASSAWASFLEEQTINVSSNGN